MSEDEVVGVVADTVGITIWAVAEDWPRKRGKKARGGGRESEAESKSKSKSKAAGRSARSTRAYIWVTRSTQQVPPVSTSLRSVSRVGMTRGGSDAGGTTASRALPGLFAQIQKQTGRIEPPRSVHTFGVLRGAEAPLFHNWSYVPSLQPARYSSCSGVRRSILMPIDSSFSLATRLSSSSGTR